MLKSAGFDCTESLFLKDIALYLNPWSRSFEQVLFSLFISFLFCLFCIAQLEHFNPTLCWIHEGRAHTVDLKTDKISSRQPQ